jgi:hypothetical protein
VFFTNSAQADQYDRAPSSQKQAIAEGAMAQLEDPGFKRYLTLPDTKRNEIQDFLGFANEALKVGILPGADSKGIVKGDGVTIAGEKNIHSLTELELRAKQYISIYGLQDSFVLEKPNTPDKTTRWYKAGSPVDMWDALISGKKSQSASSTPSTTTPSTATSTVKMQFPDGKVKLVPANDQQRFSAMGGKVI